MADPPTPRHFSGSGMAPLLAALFHAARDPLAHLTVALGGDAHRDAYPELVLPACLGAGAQALIAPFVVQEWPGCIFKGDGSITVPLVAVLLDPAQIALEIDGLEGRIAVRRADAGSVGVEPAGEVLDLRRWAPPPRRHRIIGADSIRDLNLPVIADFTAAAPPVDYLQYIPLGGERVLIGTVMRRAGGGEANHGSTYGPGHGPNHSDDPFALNPLHAALNAICG